MDILYACNACTAKKYDEIYTNKSSAPHQFFKYNKLLIDGIHTNINSITVLSGLPVNRSISKKIYFRRQNDYENNVKYVYLPFINLPILRNIWIFFGSLFFSIFWFLKHKKGYLITDVLNISIASGSLLSTKIVRRKSVGIVTDVPSKLADQQRLSFNNRVNLFIISKFSSYVFLTEYMNELLNRKNKNYIVLEGHSDINMMSMENNLSNKYPTKVCLYAGSIKKIYGIERLVKAFIQADIPDSELHIYGSGDYQDQLLDVSKEYPNIKYFGTKANEYVVQEEIRASLLINPRPTNEEYTKYSFPSKNIEYMSTGTALLTTNLPGMPKEYHEYIYLIEDESIAGLINTLRDILSMPVEELHLKGQSAKRFIVENKNNVVQAKKILEMLKDL